ncbi:deoxyribose-phosphate aldolase [Paenibacillus eucommiae]|uniref:Deoxyribose-phosphate aldolase n=1 Tax=Paenibacillus eucommiae TaxID=1355755 RepID=A0ABS4IZ88_9BACL|nr:deoxyribose-phosphate aldolase [Paenibacillus eucommiae]MBP1992865.1 deoxyribose-phosphate aldolase [Paenibacillus eucommiae]
MSTFDVQRLPAYVDHTLLKPDATGSAIDKLCEEAVKYGFYSVCVNSQWVARCHKQLEGSNVKIAAVVGFPLGASLSEVKAFEALKAAEQGAEEIDMVIAVGLLLAGEHEAVKADIRQVVQAVDGKAIVKVIIETGFLDEAQKIAACRIAEEAGAHFVKTSTGFGPGGATAEDIALMRHHVSSSLGVKASGGVRDLETAIRMIEAGANRIGTSSGVAIMNGLESSSSY